MKPAVRISLGIVAMSTSLLLVADSLLGIFPDPNAELIESRIKFSESLAIQYSSLVDDDRLAQMKPAMENTVTQMADIFSMSVREKVLRRNSLSRRPIIFDDGCMSMWIVKCLP